jgi:hypothetical protein
MCFEIGRRTTEPPAASPGRSRPVAAPSSDGIPASPPPEVLAEVDAAWERAGQLAAANRELHFAFDEAAGSLVIEIRTLTGKVLGTVAPSRALDVIGGAEL